jgi:hypothetical protein
MILHVPLRLDCFLKLLEPMEIALFQQDLVVAAYFKHKKDCGP